MNGFFWLVYWSLIMILLLKYIIYAYSLVATYSHLYMMWDIVPSESPSLVLDNWWNLGTNPCTKCRHKRMVPCQMVEQEDDHGGWWWPKDDQVLNLEKKKEKNKNHMEIKANVLLRVLVLVIKTLQRVWSHLGSLVVL